MIGANEKVFWKGSPNKVAVAFSPAMIVGFLLMLGACHPIATGSVAKTLSGLGVDRIYEDMAAYFLAAVVGLKLAWMYLSEVTTVYVLTGERLVIRKGLFLRIEDEVELYRVIDATHGVNILQRLIGVGTVVVKSNDHTGTVTMNSVNGPSRVRNGLRKLAEQCKSRRGVRILE